MGSKGRMPPPAHLRRPLPPGPSMLHPGAVGLAGIHPMAPAGPFDFLPPQVLEQKFASQHVEMQRLATENQRLAATHGVLRQELAAAQHELQMLHAHIATLTAEREQQIHTVLNKITKMEADLQAAEPVKLELQQARGDAQNLMLSRDELISKAQNLNKDIQRVHTDVQQIPALLSELESLRQEYQHCRDVVPSLQPVAAAVLLQQLLQGLNLVRLLEELVMMLPEGLVTSHLQGLHMMHKGVLLMTHRG